MTEKLSDYWEPGDQVFVHMGKRYGLTADCRTVCLGPIENKTEIPVTEPVTPLRGIKLPSKPVTPIEQGEIRRLAGLGMGYRAIARELKLSNPMIAWRVLQKPLMANPF
jgi:hypothetical protein